MFAQTTHVVAAPHGFACVGIPATWLYIPSFIEIRSGVSEPHGVEIWPFPLFWLFAFTTAGTTVQAVIHTYARGQMHNIIVAYKNTGISFRLTIVSALLSLSTVQFINLLVSKRRCSVRR